MKMTDYITQDNLREFCYNNRDIIEGEIKGVAVEFFGMNVTWPIWEPNDTAKELAKRGILLLQPLLNPWAWMSECSVAVADRSLELIFERLGLPEDTPVCVFGSSMGAYGALMFPMRTRYNVVRSVANSPATDLIPFCSERGYTNRTLITALWHDGGEGDFEEIMRQNSPINLIDEMKRIPYRLYSCTSDPVLPPRHSVSFYEAAKDKLDITLTLSDNESHCELLPEHQAAFYDDIEAAFE